MNLSPCTDRDVPAGVFRACWPAVWLIVSLSCAPGPGLAGSLFGDYTCPQWLATAHPAKKAWADAFLAPLSLTHRSNGKSAQYAYHDDPNGADKAIAFIDAYCANHPDRVAADAGAAYFRGLSSQ